METSMTSEQRLLVKLQQLSPEKIAEVENFIDFLSQREQENQQLTAISTQLSEPVFQKIWDNPDDAEYDNL
ncbi:toxin-antitoxin system, antitoxin component, Xre family protein [Leptolyngbya sp. FACHB-1624]|nr:toxin-antitoxin system, antitoxin component, Xre family protein [Leptolyngbya sp. FACHB-1624]